MDSIRSGFDDVIHSGPLAHETLRGVKFVLHHFVPHEDPAHRGLAQLMPATRRAMLGSMLLADPALLEPILGMEIKCPQEQIGTVAGIYGETGNYSLTKSIPYSGGGTAQNFDLSEVMRSGTAERLMEQVFKTWHVVPILFRSVRKLGRKGTNPGHLH